MNKDKVIRDLKERVAYLERSCDRKDEQILDLRNECVDYSDLLETSKAYKKLLKTTMEREHKATHALNEIREYIENHIVATETEEFIVQILDEV